MTPQNTSFSYSLLLTVRWKRVIPVLSILSSIPIRWGKAESNTTPVPIFLSARVPCSCSKNIRSKVLLLQIWGGGGRGRGWIWKGSICFFIQYHLTLLRFYPACCKLHIDGWRRNVYILFLYSTSQLIRHWPSELL